MAVMLCVFHAVYTHVKVLVYWKNPLAGHPLSGTEIS
jgi:hypothetical protein